MVSGRPYVRKGLISVYTNNRPSVKSCVITLVTPEDISENCVPWREVTNVN